MAEEELMSLVKRSFERVKSDIKTHDAYIEALRAEIQLLKMQIQQLTQQASQKKPNRIEEEAIRLVKQHNKIFIKQKIIATLSSEPQQLSSIKEHIVDKEGYCSKASFYRYIEELKASDKLIFVENDGITFVSVSLEKTK